MTKLFGSLLILGSALALGFSKSKQLYLRVHHLEQIKRLLIQFSGEVRFGLRPLSETFRRLGTHPGGEVFSLTADSLDLRDGRTAEECFCDAVTESYPFLSNQDKELLCTLGEGLGICDHETQWRIIESVIHNFELREQHAKEIARKNGKLYRGLGLAGGLFLILLLI